MKYETRGPAAIGKTESRSVKKEPIFNVTVTRDDGKAVTEADFCRCLQLALKQRVKREAKKARERVLQQIEWLKDNRPELYSRFVNKRESLGSLMDEIAGERRLVAAIRSGALK
jgi:hypothetical protein